MLLLSSVCFASDPVSLLNQEVFSPRLDEMVLFKLEKKGGETVEMVKNKEGIWLSSTEVRTDHAMLWLIYECLKKGRASILPEGVPLGDTENYQYQVVLGYRDRIIKLFIGDKTAEGKAYKGWVKGYNRGALVNDGFVDALEGLFHE
ncbi:MAG: hypothetical protein D6710_05840, partial [Nitrospirae bacterium]